jgi:hypothetical protein
MATLRISVEAPVAAPAAQVYTYLADYRQHHPHILPAAFRDLTIEEGGVGAGTVISFRLKAGGQVRNCHARIDEPEPGRVLTETDLNTGSVTTFTVLPDGEASSVRIETVWESGGIKGLFERLLAPRMLRPLYADELARLDRHARGLAAA